MADYSKYQDLLEIGKKLNPIQLRYIHSDAQTRAVIKGNQGGGTLAAVYDVTLRLLGIHPVESRNKLNHPIRMVTKCLPKSDSDEENQQYVELKRLFPAEFIKKDVTARSSIMTVRDPHGGSDNKVEFMSSSQELDAFMSVQRSAYYQDEEIERIKWDESQIRLLKDGGDSTITLTPARGMEWTFDSIWKRANTIYRSKLIHDVMGLPELEKTGVKSGVEAFCWASDDNPALDEASIERIFEGIDDPDELAMRRYGVFRQVSGRIYKSFDRSTHVQPFDKLYDVGLYRTYWNYRIIDFHPQKPWYVTFVVVTPRHEWFVWNEMIAKHENRTTPELRDDIKTETIVDEDDMMNRCTLIDPLSRVKQANTGFTCFDDLARGEEGLRRLTPADTKNTQGRMNIKMRLKNALDCGVPGNNVSKRAYEESRYGIYLPTLWFLDNCKGHIDHFSSWRYSSFTREDTKAVKTVRNPIQKYSDFCRNLEFLGALDPVFYTPKRDNYWEPSSLFQGQGARA